MNCLRNLSILRTRIHTTIAYRGIHHSIPRSLNFDTSNPKLQKIQQNPRVLQAMNTTVQLLVQKGLVDPSSPKPPSFMQLMKIMGDNEVKQSFMMVQKVLKEEGIEFSPTELSSFMTGMNMKEEASTGKEAEGGLFKRLSNSFKSKD